MIVFISGVPGLVKASCTSFLSALISRSRGPRLLELTAEEPLKVFTALLAERADHAVVQTHSPSAELRRVIADSGAPLLVCSDDPSWAVFYLAQNSQIGFGVAVRAVANGLASSFGFTPPGSLLVQPSDLEQPMEAFRRIADWLCMKISDDELAALAAEPRVQSAVAALAERRSSGWEEPFSDTERKIIRGALDGYAANTCGHPLQTITWRRELFLLGDHPTQAPLRMLDVTGRARMLICGPSILLPPGTWLARLYLGFSTSAVGHPFHIDIETGGQQLAMTALQPMTEGVFEIPLRFDLPQTDHAIQVRVFNANAAFEGHLALGHVVLSREASQLDPLDADVAASLDVKELAS
jgi:hypothetical protein